ncbi:hypothetical protein ACLI4R_07470 [Natrialbaceae archaeon A-chndr2]
MGTVGVLGLAGCTGSEDADDTERPASSTDDEDSSEANTDDSSDQDETGSDDSSDEDEDLEADSWDPLEAFVEYYTTHIPGEESRKAQLIEARMRKGTVDARLDGDETSYEIARTIIPRYAKTAENGDGMSFVEATRHGLHNLYNIEPEEAFILEREANGSTVIGEVFLNTGNKQNPDWEKDIFRNPAINTDIDDTPDYYLENGVQPDDEASLSTRQNFQGLYDSTRADMFSWLDWEFLERHAIEEWDESSWEGYDELNDTYLPEGIGPVMTRDALERIGDIEDFYRDGNHNETVDAIMRGTGFYLNELEDDEYLAFDIVGGELTPVAIDEDARKQLISDPDYSVGRFHNYAVGRFH